MSNNPYCYRFGSTGLRTVWSVDDAWFEGDETHDPVTDMMPPDLQLGMTEDTRHRELMHGRLQDLTTWLNQKPGPPGSSSYLEYKLLRKLAAGCAINQCDLCLCNFEFFARFFADRMNRAGNAILIDVCYEKRADPFAWEAGEHGVHLLADRLGGRRPLADIFFVTSTPGTARDIVGRHRADPAWWPLQGIPGLDKAGDTDGELDAFFQYFIAGLDRDPVRRLVQTLVRAYRLPVSDREKITHPGLKQPGGEPDIDPSLPLRDLFVRLHDVQSVKALYHDRNAEKDDGAGNTYVLKTEALQAHLEQAGIATDVASNGPSDLTLPVAPGLLFLLPLVRFVRTLEEGQRRCELDVRGGGPTGRLVVLRVPMRSPRSFGYAVETGGGGVSLEAFRQLLGCNPEAAFALGGEEDRPNWSDCFARRGKLDVRPRYGDTELILRPLIRWEATDDRLVLTWPCQAGHGRVEPQA